VNFYAVSLMFQTSYNDKNLILAEITVSLDRLQLVNGEI
jgi:hypothetical protein